KITNAAPMSVGIMSSRRLAMYCHILFPSLSFPSAGSASYTAHPQAHSDLFSTRRLRMDRLLYLSFLWISEKIVMHIAQKHTALPGLLSHPPQHLEQWLDGSAQLCGLLCVLPGQVVLLALEVQGRQGDVRFGMTWVEPQGLLQLPLHGAGVAAGPVGQGEVVVRWHRRGIAVQRRLELGHRQGQFAAFGV